METAMESGSHPEGEVRPDETAATADPAPAAPDQSEKPDPAVTANGEKLDRQTRNWRALERDRDHWREMAMRTHQPPPQSESEPARTDSKPKSLSDFEYDEGKYHAYLSEQTRHEAVKAAREELERERTKETSERRKSEFSRREEKFSKDLEDYYEVTRSPDLPITQAMAEVIAESDEPLGYFLGKNLEKAEAISRLPPLAAARELGRIEAKLIAEREAAKKPAVSQTPPPPPKLDAGEPAPETDPSRMTDAQFAKWRKRQIAQRRT